MHSDLADGPAATASPPPVAAIVPRWQQYRWTPGVRRGFIGTYVVYGGMFLIMALEALDAAQRHEVVAALLAGALAVVLATFVSRAAYRHVWLRRHNACSGMVPPVGERIWEAVRSNHVLTAEERPGAQVGADQLLWGPTRLFQAVVFPGVAALWLIDHLVSGRHHPPLQTAVLLLSLLLVARLRLRPG